MELKKCLIIGATALVLAPTVSMTTFSSVAYADEVVVTQEENVADVFEQEVTENTDINGVQYQYSYSADGETRVTEVKNLSTGQIDVISYTEGDSTIYLNDKEVANVFEDTSVPSEHTTALRAANAWKTISSGSKRVSWKKGTSVAVVAGVISIGLGSVGGPAIIAAMGTGAISIIAAAAIGGTVSYKIQRFQPSFGGPSHRYVWGFKASTGDYYGEYITHI